MGTRMAGRNIAKEHREALIGILGEECVNCGSDEDLQIHHIDEDPENNSEDNLEILCRPCHTEEHRHSAVEYPQDEVEQAVADTLGTRPFITTADIADRIDCTRETARIKLTSMEEEGHLKSMAVGRSAKVWWRVDWDA